MRNGRIGFRFGTILLGSALFFGGCSTTASAPFHMYSSPLLEGDISSPDPGFSTPGAGRGDRPGIAAKQVYTYNRWHLEQKNLRPGRQLRPESGPRPIYDTVEPLDRPVLANYPTRRATGAGSTLGGEAPDTAPLSEELATPQTQEPTSESGSADIAPANSSHSARYIHAVLKANEIDLGSEARTSVPELYRACRSAGEVYHSNRPNIGDILFFHNTADLNEDGRNNDWFTLVGIIEDVHRNGTIDFLAFDQGQVRRHQLNLDEANRHSAAPGTILNSRLRPERSDDPPFTQYLAGQLFAGFCNILGDRQDLIVIDHWTPQSED